MTRTSPTQTSAARVEALARGVKAAIVPIAILEVFVIVVGAVVTSSGGTLGYDFLAYLRAAQRVLAGLPLYDVTADVAGPFGLYLYPPPFILPIIPFTALSEAGAAWMWTILLLVAFFVGVAVLPVRRDVKWWIVLLGGLSLPFAYSVKLGQVAPVLFLLFAVGWRWIDRPLVLGASAALGALVKLQPGLVLVWAALSGRWRSVAAGAAVLATGSIVATLVLGAGPWADYADLVRRVTAPVTTPNDFTPGAVAYQLGAPEALASAIQLVSMAFAGGVVLHASRRASPTQGYLVTVVASQLLSPIVWEHYAVVLLLPTAYLLEKGRRWAVLIPLATSTPLIWLTPPIAYPIAFFAGLLCPLAVRDPGVGGART